MKILLYISILLFYLGTYSFPQFYADSVIPAYIIEFMKIADETAKSIDSIGKVHKQFSDEELHHIAELYYRCYNEDPVGFHKYVEEKHKQWEKTPFDVISGKLKMRPWLKVYVLRDKITYKLGIPFTEVIGTPAVLKCKYITRKFSDYYSKSLNIHFRPHNFIFLVEDVLKGNRFFIAGDTISILMLPNSESPSPNFNEGQSYLIPVGTNLGFNEGLFNVTFSFLRNAYDVWEMGKPPKTFPIENEIIKNVDYFGINDTSWTDFKKYFKDTFLIFD